MSHQEIVVFDWDMANGLHYQSQYLPKPALPVQVRFQVPIEIVQTISHDPLLHQQIGDVCKHRFMESAAKIDKVREETDKLIRQDTNAFFKKNKNKIRILRMLRQNVPIPDFVETYQEFLNKFNRFEIDHALYSIEHAVQHQWEFLAEQRHEYRSYKNDVIVKVAFGVTGLGLGAAGVALAIPTGGASLVLAIVVTWRALVDGFKLLYSLGKEAEKVGKEARTMIESLGKKYESKTKGKVASHEVAASVLNALVQSEMSNITKAKDKCELWKQKLAGIRTAAHDLAISLNELLEQQEALTNFLLAMDIQIQEFAHASKSSKNRKQLRKQATKLENTKAQRSTLTLKIKQILNSNEIPDVLQRAERGLKAQEAAVQALAALQNKSPGWTEKFDRYFALLVNIGLAAAGDGVGFAGSKAALDWAMTGVTTANDLAANVKDLCETVSS